MATVCITNVLGGCAASMILMESLAKSGANPMHLVTFGSFILAPLIVLIQNPSILINRHIPLKSYFTIILCFFAVNVMNNQTLNFDVPVPLFIIFRSGTLLASVLLSYIMLGRVYSWKSILSVFTITFGIILFTLGTLLASVLLSYIMLGRVYSWKSILSVFTITFGIILFTLVSSNYQSPEENRIKFLWIDYFPWPRFFTGIIAQTLCLFLSAYMGIEQEKLFGRYGKHPDEMLFYVNTLSLPLFGFLWPEISKAISQFNIIKNFEITESITLPLLWIELIAACVFQIFCVRSVYKLTSVTSTLNVNMILALRKFISIFLSAYLFGNELNIYHFLATLMIIGGSFAYYDVFGLILQKYKQKYVKKNE
uniref:UDP-xylose and UDP-N-acetylglucosamine transporter n=1 Tax=Panagrolaimus sp. PS1159 TaxID=55785 RepID=A0AC35GWC5_9BILA